MKNFEIGKSVKPYDGQSLWEFIEPSRASHGIARLQNAPTQDLSPGKQNALARSPSISELTNNNPSPYPEVFEL